MLRTVRALVYLHFAYFSRPVSNRPLLRAIYKFKAERILEIGVGRGDRAKRLIDVARRACGAGAIAYTGIDQFEMRPPTDGGAWLSLREAYRQLTARGARIRLVPGEPAEALSTAIRSGLARQDLIVIAADHAEAAMHDAWRLVPQLAHSGTQIFVEQPTARDGIYQTRLVDRQELARLAAPITRRRAA